MTLIACRASLNRRSLSHGLHDENKCLIGLISNQILPHAKTRTWLACLQLHYDITIGSCPFGDKWNLHERGLLCIYIFRILFIPRRKLHSIDTIKKRRCQKNRPKSRQPSGCWCECQARQTRAAEKAWRISCLLCLNETRSNLSLQCSMDTEDEMRPYSQKRSCGRPWNAKKDSIRMTRIRS